MKLLIALLGFLALVASDVAPKFGASSASLYHEETQFTVLTGGITTAPLCFPPFPETFDDVSCDVQLYQHNVYGFSSTFPQLNCCRAFHSTHFLEGDGDGTLVVFGGVGANNEIEYLNLDEPEEGWQYYAPEEGPVPCARYGHASADGYDGNYFIIFGGVDSATGNVLNDVWVFDGYSGGWYDITPPGFGPSPRTGAAMAPLGFRGEFGDAYVLFGGSDNEPSPTYYNDLWILDLFTWKWVHVTPTGESPAPRAFMTIGFVDELDLMVYGGVGYGDELEFEHVDINADRDYEITKTHQYYSDVWILPEAFFYMFYINDTNKWYQEFPIAWIPVERTDDDVWPAPRASAAAGFFYHGSLTIFGGRNEGRETLADIWEIDLIFDEEKTPYTTWYQLDCWPGYEFPWCTRGCSEFDYCSGHGTCLGDGTCCCDEGWSGDSCDYNTCDGYRGFDTEELNEILLPKSIESIYIKLDSIYHKLMYIRELLPSVDNTEMAVRDMALKSHNFYVNCLVEDLCEATEGFEDVIGCDVPCGSETYCTVNDTCINGYCQGGSPRDCREEYGDNKCVLSYCDEELGCQHSAVTCVDDYENHPCATASCDPERGCVYTSVDCDDGDCCTLDFCNPETNTCEHIDKCEDRNPCTVNSCTDSCNNGLCHAEWDFCCFPNAEQYVFPSMDGLVYDPIASGHYHSLSGGEMVPPQRHRNSGRGYFWLKGCGQCELIYRIEYQVAFNSIEEGAHFYGLAPEGSVAGVVGTMEYDDDDEVDYESEGVKEGVWNFCDAGLDQWDLLSGNVYVVLYFNTGDIRANLHFTEFVPNLPNPYINLDQTNLYSDPAKPWEVPDVEDHPIEWL